MYDRVIYNLNSINLEDFLKDSYEEIWNSIENEEYMLDFHDFDEFHEIIFESKVVGFIAIKSNVDYAKSIIDCYIIPEARGNNLLHDYLIKLSSSTCCRVVLRKPNMNIISALLNSGLAYKLDNLVFSWIDFEVKLDDLYKNSKIKRLYKKIPDGFEDTIVYTDFYDLDNNCVLFHDIVHGFMKNSETMIVAEPRKYDLKKYNARKKLKMISVKYLEECYFKRDQDLFDCWDFFNQLNKDLSSNYTVDNLIGSEDKLTDEVVQWLERVHMSIEDGFKIRRDIIKSIDENFLLPTFIKTRFKFLASNREYIGKLVDDSDKSIRCPYCNKSLSKIFYTCVNCGHQFESILRVDDLDIDDEIFEDIERLANERPSITDMMEEYDFIAKNNSFLYEFDDFYKKLMSYFGDDFELFIDSIESLDADKFNMLFSDETHLNEMDWYFNDDNKLDNYILKIINDKNYDEFEVYDAQFRISNYEFIKYVNENISHEKLEFLNQLNHILVEEDQYAINQGYVKKIRNGELIEYLNGFSEDDLAFELKYYNIIPEDTKEEMISQLIDNSDYTFVVTEKGRKYLEDNPILGFFAEYLREFIFYEFEKYCEDMDDLPIEEIGNKFINSQFKEAFKKGDLDVYLKYLEYYYKLNLNNEEYESALYYLIQRAIYEVNVWYSVKKHYSLEFAISLKTALFFDQFNRLNIDFDLEDIYNRAFNDFKFGHMKNYKGEIIDYVEMLLDGHHFTEVNDELLDIYFNGLDN